MLINKNMSLALLLVVSLGSVQAKDKGVLTIKSSPVELRSPAMAKPEFKTREDFSTRGTSVDNNLKELPFADLTTAEMLAETQTSYAAKKLKAPQAAWLDNLISQLCAEKIGTMKDIIKSIGSILTGNEYKSAPDKKLKAVVDSFASFGAVVREYQSSVLPLINESLNEHTLMALGVSLIEPKSLLQGFAASKEDAYSYFSSRLILTTDTQQQTDKKVKEFGIVLTAFIRDVLKSWPLSMRAYKKLSN